MWEFFFVCYFFCFILGCGGGGGAWEVQLQDIVTRTLDQLSQGKEGCGSGYSNCIWRAFTIYMPSDLHIFLLFIASLTRLTAMLPLQLSIALNKERPDLGFSVTPTPDWKWGECFTPVQGLNKKHMQTATSLRLESYRSQHTATFVENVLRALTCVVGGAQYINHEVISLCGYTMDFELLLNDEDQPIPIPNEWKLRHKGTVLKSIGQHLERYSIKKTNPQSLIESMRSSESRDNHMDNDVGYSLHLSSEGPEQLINLASDWGRKVATPRENVLRRIAIEVDGYPHFARNCDHVMGPTVLKHRQLKALGWEVVQVSGLLVCVCVCFH